MFTRPKKHKPAIWKEMVDNGFGLGPRTDQRPALEEEYRKKAKEFLAETKICAITGRKAVHVHHQRGRLGALLMDERFWIPVSLLGHRWIHDNPALARKRLWRGIPVLAEIGDWGRPGE